MQRYRSPKLVHCGIVQVLRMIARSSACGL